TIAIYFGDKHLAGFDSRGFRVGNPLDIPLPQFRFEHALGVADAAETEVADVRLAGDIGYRHFVAHTAFAQILIHDKRKFICRTETTGRRHRADDDRPRIAQQLLVGVPGFFGVIDGADR